MQTALLFEVELLPFLRSSGGASKEEWQLREAIWRVSVESNRIRFGNSFLPQIGDGFESHRVEVIVGIRLTSILQKRAAASSFNKALRSCVCKTGKVAACLQRDIVFTNRELTFQTRVEELYFGSRAPLLPSASHRIACFLFKPMALSDFSFHQKLEWNRSFGIDWDAVFAEVN
jgi:hypothetical protein